MNALKRKQVVKLARIARKTAEKIAKEENLPNKLNGMCARASAILFRLLKSKGFTPSICFGHCHCFIEIEDLVVDVTASQFGYGRIMIVSRAKILTVLNPKHQHAFISNNSHWSYSTLHKYKSIRSAKAHQGRWSWPPEQTIGKEDFI